MGCPQTTDHIGVDADPTAGWQGVQREGLRLTRVRGVARAGEKLGVDGIFRSHPTLNNVEIFIRFPSRSPVIRDATSWDGPLAPKEPQRVGSRGTSGVGVEERALR